MTTTETKHKVGENTLEKYALIGAGPAGLAGARNLQKLDIPFDGFDLHTSVGGLWDIDAPRSTMYESAHLISSKTMTEFKEFPMRKEVADYPSHRELHRYFNDFADEYNLRDYYRFNSEVSGVEPDGDNWKLTTKDGYSNTYKGVIIANGTLSEPNIPDFPGEFSGELMHSCKYKKTSIFDGKRVLIVGAGNSGCDIAVDACHRAKSVSISVRRGYHFVPKYVFGRPADTVGGKIRLPAWLKQKVDGYLLKWFTGDPERFGFPKPDHKIYECHPIVNSMVLYHIGHGDIDVKTNIEKYDGNEVVFVDGTRQEYDLIVLCTGYKLYYPFIEKEHLNWTGEAPNLFLNCFHPKYDNLFILGMVEAAGIGWQGRYDLAELLARFILATKLDTSAYRKFKKLKGQTPPDLSGGYRYMKIERMSYYVHKETYMNLIHKYLKQLKKGQSK